MDMKLLNQICAPSISLMNKFKYPTRIAILSAWVIGMSICIIFLILNNLEPQAQFSRKENYGVEYIQPVKKIISSLQKHKETSSSLTGSNIQETVAQVNVVDDKYNKSLDIQNKWSDVKNAIAKNQTNEALSGALQLVQHITNTSNLVLDPDIDTYYLMDSFCARFSNTTEKIYALMELVKNTQKKKTHNKYELIKTLTLFEELNDMIKSNQETIIEYNPETKASIDTFGIDAYNANQRLIKATTNIINGQKISYESYADIARNAISKNQKADEEYSNLLYKLIDKRVHKYADQEPISVGLTLLSLITLAYLGAGFYLALLKAVNEISNQLYLKVEDVENTTINLSSASQQLAEGASEQAASVQETSATLEETSSMVHQNKENTQEASSLAKRTKDFAKNSNSEMTKMSTSMTDLKNSSNEISKIIKVIDEIAFQTNILSLNAAVEAARAGDAGKGFAVVAEEVRNLAQRSAQAAKDTTVIIASNIELSEESANIANLVRESVASIEEQATKVSDLLEEIAVATNEQAQGVEQINKAISQMEVVLGANAQTAESTAAAAVDLSKQSAEIKEVVNSLIVLVG